MGGAKNLAWHRFCRVGEHIIVDNPNAVGSSTQRETSKGKPDLAQA
jgi:hypothetical protein